MELTIPVSKWFGAGFLNPGEYGFFPGEIGIHLKASPGCFTLTYQHAYQEHRETFKIVTRALRTGATCPQCQAMAFKLTLSDQGLFRCFTCAKGDKRANRRAKMARAERPEWEKLQDRVDRIRTSLNDHVNHPDDIVWDKKLMSRKSWREKLHLLDELEPRIAQLLAEHLKSLMGEVDPSVQEGVK